MRTASDKEGWKVKSIEYLFCIGRSDASIFATAGFGDAAVLATILVAHLILGVGPNSVGLNIPTLTARSTPLVLRFGRPAGTAELKARG